MDSSWRFGREAGRAFESACFVIPPKKPLPRNAWVTIYFFPPAKEQTTAGQVCGPSRWAPILADFCRVEIFSMTRSEKPLMGEEGHTEFG